MTDVALELRRRWADENLVAGFAELLARHPPAGREAAVRRLGRVVACSTGRRAGFFNPVIVLEPVPPADLAAALDWMADRGHAYSVRIRDDVEDAALRDVLVDHGLVREAWVEPAMVMTPLPAPPSRPAGLEIVEATEATLDAFYAANTAAFDLPAAAVEMVRDLTPPEIIGDPDIRLFGGYLDGAPAGCAFAIRSPGVVGVYAVGTASTARRRGVGTAMTWVAIDAGRTWGCRAATLQASAMGEPIYRAMGFETVTRYVTWSQPPSTPTGEAGPPGGAGDGAT